MCIFGLRISVFISLVKFNRKFWIVFFLNPYFLEAIWCNFDIFDVNDVEIHPTSFINKIWIWYTWKTVYCNRKQKQTAEILIPLLLLFFCSYKRSIWNTQTNVLKWYEIHRKYTFGVKMSGLVLVTFDVRLKWEGRKRAIYLDAYCVIK